MNSFLILHFYTIVTYEIIRNTHNLYVHCRTSKLFDHLRLNCIIIYFTYQNGAIKRISIS